MRKFTFVPHAKACCITTSSNGYVGDVCSVHFSSRFPVQVASLVSTFDDYAIKKKKKTLLKSRSGSSLHGILSLPFLHVMQNRCSEEEDEPLLTLSHFSTLPEFDLLHRLLLSPLGGLVGSEASIYSYGTSPFQRTGLRFQSKECKRDQSRDGLFQHQQEPSQGTRLQRDSEMSG